MSRLQTPAAAVPAPVAIIQIVLAQDGSISCNAKGLQGRPMANMMFETARQDLLAVLIKAEQAKQSAGLVVPPAEMAGLNLRG